MESAPTITSIINRFLDLLHAEYFSVIHNKQTYFIEKHVRVNINQVVKTIKIWDTMLEFIWSF